MGFVLLAIWDNGFVSISWTLLFVSSGWLKFIELVMWVLLFRGMRLMGCSQFWIFFFLNAVSMVHILLLLLLVYKS